MLQWENKEEEPEDPLQDPQVEEDHQEEDLQLEELRINQLPRQQTLKQWAKIPLPSTETGAKLIHS